MTVLVPIGAPGIESASAPPPCIPQNNPGYCIYVEHGPEFQRIAVGDGTNPNALLLAEHVRMEITYTDPLTGQQKHLQYDCLEIVSVSPCSGTRLSTVQQYFDPLGHEEVAWLTVKSYDLAGCVAVGPAGPCGDLASLPKVTFFLANGPVVGLDDVPCDENHQHLVCNP